MTARFIDVPTEPGVYWMYWPPSSNLKPSIAVIEADYRGQLSIRGTASGDISDPWTMSRHHGVFWFGPLEPPDHPFKRREPGVGPGAG